MGEAFRRASWYADTAIIRVNFSTFFQSLIDLAGSEKATSDKDRTREGRYINTRYGYRPYINPHRELTPNPSLLTLGSVIGTLAENAAKKKVAPR